LPPETQRTLADALSAGLRGISDAIAYLQEMPKASVDDVLRAGKDGRQGESAPLAPRGDLPWALAADVLLSEVLALVRTRQTCFRSKSIQSELVFVALCGLALRFIDELNRLMDSRPHYRGALVQCGLSLRQAQGKVWPFDAQPMVPVQPLP